MKVYVCTDLEGVSGVTSFDKQVQADSPYYDDARKLLTAEVNAAAEGMLEEGVTDVLVLDGHGPGAIRFEDLHPTIKLLHGRPIVLENALRQTLKGYDVAMMIGQHAMAGVQDGTLNHTQNSRTIEYYKLNGQPIGEIAQFALCCGALGVPMIFLSGDRAACREAEELIAGMTTVSVKEGLTRTAAISFAPAEARRRIREGVKRALATHREKPIAPLVWPSPFVLEKRYFYTEVADAYHSCPFATRIDAKTVYLKSENIFDVIYA